MSDSNSELPYIAEKFLSSGAFLNAVSIFITKQQAESLAKDDIVKEFRCFTELEKESIRAALPRNESTIVKLLKAALVRLSGCNQPCFTSDEQFRKANPNTAYSNLSLNMVITLDSRHPMIQRKNNERKNNVASKIHGCQRIADFYLALNQTASKWVKLLLEVFYPQDPFVTNHFLKQTLHRIFDRVRTDLKNQMNQSEHPLHNQYFQSLALFSQV
jgi:hypothetical protein